MSFQGESAVQDTGPIIGDFLVGLERINKVVCVFFGKIFDAEIVNAQCECGWSCSVDPEAWMTWGGFVNVWGEVVNELVEGNYSCLFEAIHAASYSKVYKNVGRNGDVVAWIIPHLLGNHLWEDVDVLVLLHGSAKLEVFDIDAEVAGTFVGIGDGAIYVELGIKHYHGRRAGITGEV